MDVRITLNQQRFVWDSEKASLNLRKHGISFDEAVYVFLDPLVRYTDASVEDETRDAAIGQDAWNRLLLVVYVLREDDVIRLVSARQAGGKEKREYEEHE